MERTLVLVKPDGVARRLVGEVIGALERKGLRLVAMKLMVLSRAQAERHYAPLRERPFYPALIDFITSGPVVAAVAEGPDAVAQWRTSMGATDPAKAAPGTLRQRLALDVQMNLVHGSDSVEAAAREIANLFAPDELVQTAYPDERWTFGPQA
jgi:nucleoside-diphosphate kinase